MCNFILLSFFPIGHAIMILVIVSLVGGGRSYRGGGLELGHALHGRGLQAAVGDEELHGG